MPSKKKNAKEKDKKASLLDGDELSHLLQATLEQIFRRFDIDVDGALSIEELQAFARACNDGEAFGEDELEDLRYFQTNEQGHLTKYGFLQMYHTQTVARPADTWQDLKALGYDNSLALLPELGYDNSVALLPEHLAESPAAEAPPTSTSPPVSSVVVTAADYCKQSDTLYTEGKHDAALRSALAAVQLDGASAEAHRCAGRAFHALGRIEQGERSWLRANELAASAGATTASAGATTAAAGATSDDAGRGAAAALKDERVELVGLSKKELNGARGVARAYDAVKGRVAVEVEGHGTMAFKLANLRKVADELVLEVSDQAGAPSPVPMPQVGGGAQGTIAAPAAAVDAAVEAAPPAAAEAPTSTPRAEAAPMAATAPAAVVPTFAAMHRAINDLHDALEALAGSSEGSNEWARAVLLTHASYAIAEDFLGSEQPTLRSVRPEWRTSPKALLAVAERVTDLLPDVSAAWAMRGDACMGIAMGSSIASDFYEKAEALAPEGPVRASLAAKKEAASALFLTNLGIAGEQLEKMQSGA